MRELLEPPSIEASPPPDSCLDRIIYLFHVLLERKMNTPLHVEYYLLAYTLLNMLGVSHHGRARRISSTIHNNLLGLVY